MELKFRHESPTSPGWYAVRRSDGRRNGPLTTTARLEDAPLNLGSGARGLWIKAAPPWLPIALLTSPATVPCDRLHVPIAGSIIDGVSWAPIDVAQFEWSVDVPMASLIIANGYIVGGMSRFVRLYVRDGVDLIDEMNSIRWSVDTTRKYVPDIMFAPVGAVETEEMNKPVTFTYCPTPGLDGDNPAGAYTATLREVTTRGWGTGGLCLSPCGQHEWIVWISGKMAGTGNASGVRGASTACAGLARAERVS